MQWTEEDDGEWAMRYDADALAVVLAKGSIDEEDDEEIQSQAVSSAAQSSEQERAVLGDKCPICLHSLDDPVMIQGCHHVYCLACLSSWARNLALHGLRTPTCPLCKRAFHAAYADVVSEADYQLLRFDGSAAARRKHSPTDDLLRRTMIYTRRMRLLRVNGVAVDGSGMDNTAPAKPVKTAKHEYSTWLERELRACVGPDVDLTVLLALIESVLGPPEKREVDWRVLQQTLAPFLLGDAEVFVREFAFFLGSRLNMHAYDDVIDYGCSGEHDIECSIASCSTNHSI